MFLGLCLCWCIHNYVCISACVFMPNGDISDRPAVDFWFQSVPKCLLSLKLATWLFCVMSSCPVMLTVIDVKFLSALGQHSRNFLLDFSLYSIGNYLLREKTLAVQYQYQ